MENPHEQDNAPHIDDHNHDDAEAISLFNAMSQDSLKDSTSELINELDHEQRTNTSTGQNPQQGDQGQTPDPWATVPEPLRNEYLTLKQQHQQLNADHRANAGRVSALTKKLNEVTAGLAANEKANGEYANRDAGMPSSDDLKGMNFAEVEEEFPEIAAFVRSQVNAAQDAFKQQLSPLEELRQQQEHARRQAELQTQFDALASVHPDYQQISQDPSFHQWVATQPPSVQAMAQSDFADDNIALLSLFKGTRQGYSAPRGKSKTSLSDYAEIPRKGAGRAAADADDVDPVAYFNLLNSKS